MVMLLHSQVGAAGTGLPMTTSAAVGKQLTQASLIRYRLDVPCLSTSTNRTSARIFKWCETVDWPTPEAATISPTLIGARRRASSDTIWIRVASASALNQLAYSSASARGRGPSSLFIVNRR